MGSLGMESLDFVPTALAQARRPDSAKKESPGRAMIVKTDSAIVFSRPDMDSDSIAYLSAGDAIRVSRRIYGGPAGHRFYRIALPNGKFGYIATIDVGAGRSAKASKAAKSRGEKPGPKNLERLERARLRRELSKPMMFNTWFGLFLGQMRFKEKVPGVKAEDDLLVYGFKVTGPDVLLSGPLMDMNFTLYFGAPRYYRSISRVKPSGVLFATDALLLMPFGMGQDSALYLGLGPWLKYSSFKYVSPSGALATPSKFGLGASLAVGGAYRVGPVSARLEGKYIFERVTHQVIQLSVQTFY